MAEKYGNDFLFFDTLYRKPVLIPTLIISSSLVIVLLNLYGLQHGVSIVLPHLFYLPIILTSYYYPRYGILYGVLLAFCYCVLVLAEPSPDVLVVISAVARAVVFVGIAVVVSVLSARMHRDTQMCRRLVSAVRSSSDAIIGELPDGTITDWNSGAEQLYGYVPQEIIGTSIFRLIPPELQQEKRLLLERIRNGETIERIETERITKDGRRLQIFLSSSPIFDGMGTIAGVSEIAHDITERKRAGDALALANRKLNLLSSITRHDIRNQLMALGTYVELCEENISNPVELKHFLMQEKKIAEAIERQISFTKDYEDLGVKAAVWHDLDPLVLGAGAALQLGSTMLDSRCRGYAIFADPLVEKVFYNLIDNSLRYGGEKLTILRIAARVEGDHLQIVFEDDGNGITHEDKKHLFTKGFGRHTGLGLFLSREILAITGITITENGEPGTGARFEITVPPGAWRETGS